MQTPSPNGVHTLAPTLAASAAPWWRHPLVWMVIGGPAVVVVAGFFTLWLALRAPDPVVRDERLRTPAGAVAASAVRPAMEARNHVTTPSDDLPPAEGAKP